VTLEPAPGGGATPSGPIVLARAQVVQ
jgi:hypothetical protein